MRLIEDPLRGVGMVESYHNAKQGAADQIERSRVFSALAALLLIVQATESE
jgi:hypothetical protein